MFTKIFRRKNATTTYRIMCVLKSASDGYYLDTIYSDKEQAEEIANKLNAIQ